MLRIPCLRLPAGIAAAAVCALTLGFAAPSDARPGIICHILERNGTVTTTPNTFDTSLFMTYTPGLAGSSPGTGATAALYLYDTAGLPMTSGTGEVICAPCTYSLGTTPTTPRKQGIRVDDLIMAHGGFGTSSAPRECFAVVEVTGDADHLAMESRLESSGDVAGDISICPVVPHDVLKDWFEPATPRVFVVPHLFDKAGNTSLDPYTTDCVIRAVYAGGLGSVPAGSGASVELYLYNDNGTPMTSTTGPICAPCTYALGTTASNPRWLEVEVDGLTPVPTTKQGFAIVRVAGADPGAVVLEGEGQSTHAAAGRPMFFSFTIWAEPRIAPSLAVDEPDAPGATLMLRSAPNPATSAMTFDFELAHAAHVDLEVFDAAGRRVATVATGAQAAGRHELRWDRRDDGGNSLAAGIYYGRLKANDGSRVTRLVFLP